MRVSGKHSLCHVVVELLVVSACMFPSCGKEKGELLNVIVRPEVEDLRQESVIAFSEMLPVPRAGTDGVGKSQVAE